jgi:hypothetical protein
MMKKRTSDDGDQQERKKAKTPRGVGKRSQRSTAPQKIIQ